MDLIRRLTSEKRAALRAELVLLEERIRKKIRWIMVTYQKLPYDRLATGRELKETCLLAISYLDQGNNIRLNECLRYLKEKGMKI